MDNSQTQIDLYSLESKLLQADPGKVNKMVEEAKVNIKELTLFGSMQLIRLFIGRILPEIETFTPFAQGRIFLSAGKLSEAKKAFERSIQDGNELDKSHCNLGATLMKEGDEEGAITHFELSAKFGDLRSRLNLFEAYRCSAVDRAEEAFKQLEILAATGAEGMDAIFAHAEQYVKVDDRLTLYLMNFLVDKNHIPALHTLLAFYEKFTDKSEFERLLAIARGHGYLDFKDGEFIALEE